jgi:2-polyprenyl-3-methyl-5-hydroxy-6-metoxy-1,4-benzoquinol methylase
MPCPVCQKEGVTPVLKKEDLVLISCVNCGLVRLKDLSSKFDIKNYDYYENRLNVPLQKLYNPINEKRYTYILQRMEKYRKNNEIMDIGCGMGQFLAVAKKFHWKTTGTEIAPYAIEICRQFGNNVLNSDLLSLDLRENYYDVVTMFEVLEHLTRPREYITKISKILRKEGVLILTTPNFSSITRFLVKENWRVINQEHLFYFVPRSLKSLLADCNFKILEFEVKNITLPEIMKFIKRDLKEDRGHEQELRGVVESSKFLFLLKSLMNKILDLTGTGEVIYCICQKR